MLALIEVKSLIKRRFSTSITWLWLNHFKKKVFPKNNPVLVTENMPNLASNKLHNDEIAFSSASQTTWDDSITKAKNLLNMHYKNPSSAENPEVVGFSPLNERSEKEYFTSIFLKLKFALECSINHPLINTINTYYLQAGGKRLRPLMILLLSRSFYNNAWELKSRPWTSFETLAQICELMHIASLMHDDVIDGAHSRRKILSAPMVFGNKASVLSGDYLLAMSTNLLAQIRSFEVFDLISQVVSDLSNGELMQMDVPPDSKFSLDYYIEKSYLKTASLIAKSFQSAAILAGHPREIQDAAFDYGKNFGIAFQIMDDILDYQVSSDQFGKTSAQDLINGQITAPFIFATLEHPILTKFFDQGFENPEDVKTAFNLITNSTAIEKAKSLANVHRGEALAALDVIQNSFKQSDKYLDILRELTLLLTERKN